MVNVRFSVILTTLLLERITAAPLSDRTLSIATVEARGVHDLYVGSRNTNGAAVIQVEARKAKDQEPKMPKPQTSKPKTPKPKTPKPPKPSKPTTCVVKSTRPRGLDRREGSLKAAKSAQDIGEDMYVLSADGRVVVTNLSGCTAIFLWDASNKPSVFHVFCGDETAKAWEAIDKVSSKARAYSIIASRLDRYNNAKKEIVDYAASEGWEPLEEQSETLYKVDKSDKTVLKLTAASGNRHIVRLPYPNPNCG